LNTDIQQAAASSVKVAIFQQRRKLVLKILMFSLNFSHMGFWLQIFHFWKKLSSWKKIFRRWNLEVRQLPRQHCS